MLWLAYAAVAVAVSWILLKLYMAYNSAGGTVMVAVYDAAVYPPILGTVGLYFVLPTHRIDLSPWIYVAIWVVTTVVTAGAIRLMEELGDKPL